MKNILLESGYVFNQALSIWTRLDYTGINYSDGDEAEQRIASIISQTADITVLSSELRQHCTDWPSLYHLSGSRANILRPFESVLKGDILEIGAGCGAITRYLGECSANVLALEGSPRRAVIARSRTRDLENVTVLAESFDHFQCDHQFDVITLIGVLEYANLFTSGENPPLTMLQQVRSLLKPEGKLIIAIENQLGLKYFAGAPEDHLGQPMVGIEGRYRVDQPKTFGRAVVTNMLEQAGFKKTEFLAPFPDYKLPVSILTENGLTSKDFDASAFAWQSVRRDPQLPAYCNFSLELTWPEIFQNKLGLDLANSFLIIASVSDKALIDSRVLAYHYSTDRVIKYCRETVFTRADNKDICVQYRNFSKVSENTDCTSDPLIRFICHSASEYVIGEPLSLEFVHLVTKDGWSFDQVGRLIRRYLSIVGMFANSNGMQVNLTSPYEKLPGEFFDVLPQNIIVRRDDGSPALIDKEWQLIGSIEIGYLLFRSFLWLISSVTRYGRPATGENITYYQFFDGAFEAAGFRLHDEDYARYISLEAKVQETVTGLAAEEFLPLWKDQPLPISNLSQAMAERDNQVANLNQAIAKCDNQIGSLHQALAERDGQIDSLHQALAERDGQIDSLNEAIVHILSSHSWRATAPLRLVGEKYRTVLRIWTRLIQIAALIRPHMLRALRDPYWGRRTALNALHILRASGWRGFELALTQKRQIRTDYDEWIRLYDRLTDADRKGIKDHISTFRLKPLISILMPVYNTPEIWLRKAIESVRTQLYPHWELCIADDASTAPHIRRLLEEYQHLDPRIRIAWRAQNGHISAASNSALELAQGEFIAMLDHDDELSEHALYLVAEELNRNPELDFIYSDQDKIDTSGTRYDPYFKPDFNPDLLRAQNYVDHLAVFRTSIVRDLGGWRTEFDGSQDYDLVLRFIERTIPSRVCHIPYVLYHWRAVSGSIANHVAEKGYAPIRSRKALAEHLQRIGIEAQVTSQYPDYSIHRVVYPLPEKEPLVSVIIPTKDGLEFLSRCIDGILHKTEYSNLEIIIVNNRSKNSETYEYFKSITLDYRIKILDYDQPFNYSKINNLAVREAKGTVIALLNNDVEVINSDWLREMVSHAIRPEIGAVGARLYYSDDTVQHAGGFLGYRGRAGHIYRYTPRHWMGHWARGILVQNLTAVTAACMVLRRDIFEEVGGFDEERLTITFNDVDLCLRIHEKGYRNLYTPFAELYHFESKTRGLLAFQNEEDYFAARWRHLIKADPAYNPNLTLESEDLTPAFPPRVRRPWLVASSENIATPLVTIITRTYGSRQEFLHESLQSVFRQTYRPIQIVVVEDGSNNARSIIEQLSPPDRITIDYESLPKKGRCYAGNRGLELAKGEMIGFLDDDDLLLPNHIESLVQDLHKNTSAVGAYSCAWEVPTEVISAHPLKYREGVRRLFGANFSLPSLWNYNFLPIQSLLFRRELYLRYGGFDEQLDCLEDWDLWLRYTTEEDFIYVDKPTSLFRIPSNETILTQRREQHLSYLPLIRKRQKDLVEKYINTPYYNRLRTAYDGISVS